MVLSEELCTLSSCFLSPMSKNSAYITPSDPTPEFQGKAMKESSAVKKWEGGRGKVTEN